MRSYKAVSLSIAFLIISAILLAPFIFSHTHADHEIWLFQAIREMQDVLKMTPTLNNEPIKSINPLTIKIISLFPSTDIIYTRLLPLCLGCISAAAVSFFCLILLNLRTAMLSALFCITSFGFISTYTSINTAALPCTLAVLAYMIFSLVYLKKASSALYIISYLLIGLATITGGWIMPAFFILSIVLLILLDLSPGRFSEIKPVWGIGIISLITALFYIVYWYIAGWTIASSSLSPGQNLNFTSSMYSFATYTFPWFILAIPAWIYTERPEDKETWRMILPFKIGFCTSICVLWFSGHCPAAYALLGVPFVSVLAGIWVAGGMQLPQKVLFIRPVAVILTGALIFATEFFITGVNAYKDMNIHIYYIIAGLLSATLIFLILLRKQRLSGIIALFIITAMGISWVNSVMNLPEIDPDRLSYVQGMSTYSPLLVYEDDLVMRGYLGYTGNHPIVTGREVLPIGQNAYLAVNTEDLDDLVTELNEDMPVAVESSYHAESTFALIRIPPLQHSMK